MLLEQGLGSALRAGVHPDAWGKKERESDINPEDAAGQQSQFQSETGCTVALPMAVLGRKKDNEEWQFLSISTTLS